MSLVRVGWCDCVVLCAWSGRRVFGEPERAYLEEVVFSFFCVFLVRVLKKVKNRQESRKKSYCFLKWCFIINSERTLPSVLLLLLVGRRSQLEGRRKGWLPPDCHSAGAAQGGALWPFSAGRLGSSSVPTYSSSLYKVQPKARRW